MTLRAAVVTCSDGKVRDPASDESGPAAADLLKGFGFDVTGVTVVSDDVERIGAAIGSALADGCRVVVLTGGTGLGPRDVTPEAVARLGGRDVPGIGEAIRAASRERVPTADLSRAGAVAVSDALVLMLPGSPGGVRDGLAVAGPLLQHAVAMLDGGGHPSARSEEAPLPHPEQHSLPRPEGAHPRPEQHPLPRPEQHFRPHPERRHLPFPESVEGRPSADASTGSATGAGSAIGAGAAVGPEPIDVAALARAVERPAAGAIATFEGRVRDHDHGRAVTALTYEAHPDATATLAAVVAEASARSGVSAAVAAHRTGDLRIGDLAFAVAVAAAHRREAFETCAWLVDEAKARTPIWKHQTFADGTTEWVNCP